MSHPLEEMQWQNSQDGDALRTLPCPSSKHSMPYSWFLGTMEVHKLWMRWRGWSRSELWKRSAWTPTSGESMFNPTQVCPLKLFYNNDRQRYWCSNISCHTCTVSTCLLLPLFTRDKINIMLITVEGNHLAYPFVQDLQCWLWAVDDSNDDVDDDLLQGHQPTLLSTPACWTPMIGSWVWTCLMADSEWLYTTYRSSQGFKGFHSTPLFTRSPHYYGLLNINY